MPLSSRCQWNDAPNSWPLNVRLHALDGEGQLGQGVVDELDRGLLVAARVGAQDPQPGAVVDRGELIVLAPATGLAERLDELDIDLQLVARARLFIPLPAAVMALVPLRGRQPVKAQPLEDAPHP